MLEILAKLSDISERTARIEEKCQRMETDIDHIREQDIRQNELLDKHILGVQTNTQRLELEIKYRKEQDIQHSKDIDAAKDRLDALETAPKFRKQLVTYIKQGVLYISAIGGALLMLDKFFNFL